jgi:hypothetical protein
MEHDTADFSFYWADSSGDNELHLHDTTPDEAFKQAKEFGFKPTRWWRPSTWSNCVVMRDGSNVSIVKN